MPRRKVKKKVAKKKVGRRKNITKKQALDPRQVKFLTLFLDPKSKTYANFYQSAVKAGYSKKYAEDLTYEFPDWLRENTGDQIMLAKAERNLNEALDGQLDEAGKAQKIKFDATKFAKERLDKDKWSRTENINHTFKRPFEDIEDEELENIILNSMNKQQLESLVEKVSELIDEL